jgi:hypothetical protein
MVKLQVLGNNSKTVFDEKRKITPKWVKGFTSKLQGR